VAETVARHLADSVGDTLLAIHQSGQGVGIGSHQGRPDKDDQAANNARRSA
jgi:hypothetical protein